METRAVGRHEWERILRRLVLPDRHKYAALLLATWGDNDGTRVRPGPVLLGAAMGGKSEHTGRRMIEALVGYGLLELVSRGGGRGGKGKTSEYRLTVPVDLLDRFELLDPNGRPVSPSTQVDAQSEHGPVDNSESPSIWVDGQSPVDNSNDRPKTAFPAGMSVQNETNERPPRWPTTSTDQTTKETRDQSPPSATTDPAHDDVDNSAPRLTLDEVLPLSKPPKPPPRTKCAHGLSGERHPDGSPRCPLCRRDAVLDAQPLAVPEHPRERP